ncbi:SDR family oxidoreductase [Microbacterium sp. LRZ72]|uniref:SDR family oxidoreductase n=1 Tax=Microbacterium sp. LRZ72 TaxID=2942481 RepID=UPI0029BE3C82|nr:SDR family oxidoreductase [Microbacterium sp. LRZ72]MDX2375237.1 SDR family oxidoreductase [Microbacterium sp. LRZ72]
MSDVPPVPARPTALVTGATGGMGSRIVADLRRTHGVVALGRDPERLRALAEKTGCRGERVDVTDPDAVADVVAGLPRLDVLVHAAAVAQALPVDAASAQDWHRQLDTNVVAPALLTRVALPLLRQAQGTVVFIGSGAGTRPVPGSAVYSASKHALRALADVLRIDEEPHRIRVVTIAPGQTDTAMLRGMIESGGGDYRPELYIRPESVAQTVRFVVDAPGDVHLTDVAVRPRVEISRL